MKSVEFNGQKFDVSEWAKFITMNRNGVVQVWEQPPKSDDGMYYAVYPGKHSMIGGIRQLDRYKEIS